MILARISKAVREQNWFAVVLEFVIVIAGVVIGFQITAWNGERADRAVISQQLREVRADLQADIVALETARNASLWRVAASEFILERINGAGDLPDLMIVFDQSFDPDLLPVVTEAEHASLLARVNLIRGTVGQRTGYESLVNAGNLRLIRDDALSAAIQRYYAGYEDLENNLDIFREIRATALPILYRHGFSLFSEQDLAAVLAAAGDDPELLAYIRTARELGRAQTGIVINREREALALLEQVETELAE